MAAETGFIINDVPHEIPTLDTFTMAEAQVLYDYCGLTIEDFAIDDDDSDEDAEFLKKIRHPGFQLALMHVAYQRANPDLSAKKVKDAVGNADLNTNKVAYYEAMSLRLEAATETEADAVPPASTTEPEKSSNESSVDSENNPEPSGERTGNSSLNGSDGPETDPPITTTFESATSSDSPPISLAK